MAKNSYHDYLRKVPLFSDLTDSELDSVSLAATELNFPAGRTIIKEGELAHEMFVIVNGTVAVSRGGEFIAEIGPGGFVGEMALLTHGHRNSTVTAVTDLDVIHLDGRQFGAMLDQAPHIAVKMLPIVANRVNLIAQ